jgi:ribosomal protein L11 methyltransferase
LTAVEGVYDVVLANIEARVLLDIPAELCARIAPRGFLVLSGVLREERDAISAAYRALRSVEWLGEGPWCACVMEPEVR